MGSFSIWHWTIVAAIYAVIIIPAWRIVRKAGFNGAFSLLLVIPLVNLVALWVFGFIRWPVEHTNS